jgi:stalled ribosome rescue protein Dom34
MSKQVAVWIDHTKASIFHLSAEQVDTATVIAPHHNHHRHPKGPEGGKAHPEDAQIFFRKVARSLDDAEQILLVGPSTARVEFGSYLHQHDRPIEARVVASETVDHPTDPQLVAFAKKHFGISNRVS